MNRLAPIILPLIAVLLLAGCAATSPSAQQVVDGGTETVAFFTDADRLEAVDVATAILVAHDFTITLANERIGLVQTDYASVANIEALRADSGRGDPALDDLYVRLTVNADDRGDQVLVQLKGSFQRMGPGSAPDRILGLYWMDRLAADMAGELRSEYAPRVTAETYNQALDNVSIPTGSGGQERVGSSLKAVGIVGAILFAATLVVSVLSPSSSR